MATTKMVGASHTIRVKTLYRHALKNLQNWTVWREMFIEKGFELRAQFDAQKKLTDPKMIEEVVSKAEAKLAELKHPDPYTSARRVYPHRKRARTTAAFLLFSPTRVPLSPRSRSVPVAVFLRSPDDAGRQQIPAPSVQQHRLPAGGERCFY